jgi:hypothetical protein
VLSIPMTTRSLGATPAVVKLDMQMVCCST